MIQAEFEKRRKRDETVMCKIGVLPIWVFLSNQCHSSLGRVSKAGSTPYVNCKVLISDLLSCVSESAHKSIHSCYFFFLTVLNVTSTQTNITLDEGSTTTLNCSVIFSEAFAVDKYWLLNGKIASKPEVLHQEVNGMSMANKVKRLSITLELKHVTLAQSGIYTCGANSTIGLKTHDIAVNIRDTHGPDLKFTQKTKSYVKIANGTNVTLSCLGIYPAALFDETFWLFNGSQIKSNKHFEINSGFVENNEENIKRRLLSLTIYNAGVEDSGKYECVLNTSHGLRRKNIKVYVSGKGFFSIRS